MTSSLITAWSNISSPQQDASPYSEFRPDLYRYTNSTNIWKKRTEKSYNFQDGENVVSFAVRGEMTGPRSGKHTFLNVDRQGGPALTLTPEWKSNANVDQYRVVLIDPRGAGQSFPVGDIQNNTTQKLVWDMEQARRMGAASPDEKIVLRGNCWGMTESVLYAVQYPENVAGLVLGLPFLARRKDTEWLYGKNGGAAKKYSAAFNKLMDYAKTDNVPEMMDRFIYDLSQKNSRVQAEALAAFLSWEYALYDGEYHETADTIDVSNPYIQQEIATRLIQARYTRNDFDLGPDGITPYLSAIPKNIPIIIVGNLNDPLNDPDTIDVIRQSLPQAEIIMQDADWHWIPNGAVKEEKSNYFLQQAYPYAMGRMGFILSGELNQKPGFTPYPRICAPC